MDENRSIHFSSTENQVFIKYYLYSIEEALSVIKSWNAIWSLQYNLTYYCEAEYNSISKVIDCPSTPSYICDFHREQAWLLAKMNKLGNLNVKEYWNNLLILWRSSSNDLEF